MRTATRTLTILTLALLLASPLGAADKKKKGERGKKKARRAPVAVFVPKSIELTDEQKTKVAALNKEYGPKLAELQKKLALTPEQRKAGAKAHKAIKESGKKGKEAQQAMAAALNLTDEQKQVQKEQRALRREARQKFLALLTPEQKQKAHIGGKRKGHAKKKASQ